MDFTNEDTRHLIYFFWRDGKNSVQISNKINEVLGEGTISDRTCRRWIERFEEGNFIAKDAPRAGRPSVDLNEQIEAVLNDDRYATSREIAQIVGISHTHVLTQLHKMGKRYMVNRWLPHKLSEDNKADRKRIASELLNPLNRDNFLFRLITVDETWIY